MSDLGEICHRSDLGEICHRSDLGEICHRSDMWEKGFATGPTLERLNEAG